MSINHIVPNFSPIEHIVKPAKTEPGQGLESEQGGSFADVLNKSLKEVNDLQKTADSQIEHVIMGAENVSPHTAMIALEKADMAFQMMSAIRAKIIRAYEEVIRTQV